MASDDDVTDVTIEDLRQRVQLPGLDLLEVKQDDKQTTGTDRTKARAEALAMGIISSLIASFIWWWWATH